LQRSARRMSAAGSVERPPKRRLVLTHDFCVAKGEATKADADAAAASTEGRIHKTRRKSGLVQEVNSVGASTPLPSDQSQAARQSNEPILDLNSILRGKKVKVVTGEEEVADAYALVMRVLDKTRSVKAQISVAHLLCCGW